MQSGETTWRSAQALLVVLMTQIHAQASVSSSPCSAVYLVCLIAVLFTSKDWKLSEESVCYTCTSIAVFQNHAATKLIFDQK